MQSFFIIDRYLLTSVMLMFPLIALRAEQNGNGLESSDRLKKDESKNKRNLSARTRPSSRKTGDIKKPTGEQASGNAEVLVLDRMIVVSNRASLATAQEVKQEKIEIADSVIANTINKLPDFNVSDVLQRITGVQILRDRGEGSTIQIRGLSQVETFLNGREIFTAGNGRNRDYADIPADMLAGIDVYKTPSPDFIEGGIGGTVNLRTHRPFDFLGREIVGTVRGVYGDLADSAEPQFSTLLSDRWRTESFGEFGALFNFSYQKRAWREDQKSTGNPVARGDLLADQIVIAASGTSESTSIGNRERMNGSLVLQWQVNDRLDLYAEGNYSELKTPQDTYQINVAPLSEANAIALNQPAFAPNSVQLFDGSQDLKSITWTNATASILSFARDTVDRIKQGAFGGTWRGGSFNISSDLSYTESVNKLFFFGPFMSANVANFSQNLSGQVPSTSVGGTDLLNQDNFTYSGLALRQREFKGRLATVRVDGEYLFSGGYIDSVSMGYRYRHRGADNEPGLIFADTFLSGLSAADLPGYVQPNQFTDFMAGKGTSIGPYLAGNLATARDLPAIRKAFGVTGAIPASNPSGTWRIKETTDAGYILAKFNGGDLPLDGNFGLRVVHTQENLNGYQILSSTNEVTPISISSSYTDLLPSTNLRYRLSEALNLRFGASRTITRPDFNQLSPTLVLVPNSITPALNSGSAGNPRLTPVRSTNIDGSVEYYFNKNTSVTLAGFWKEVDGFVANASNEESYFGQTFLVTRPYNSNKADIKGFEFNYQQFYDFLPGWLSGFGFQGNYTFVDSKTYIDALQQTGPLQNFSKHSFNLIGMYDKDNFSVRIAYNWRDKFLSGIANIVGVGALPVYTDGYGWLDASVIYRVNKHMSIALEGLNLLGTVRNSNYGVETRPQNAFVNDIQAAVSMTLKY